RAADTRSPEQACLDTRREAAHGPRYSQGEHIPMSLFSPSCLGEMFLPLLLLNNATNPAASSPDEYAIDRQHRLKGQPFTTRNLATHPQSDAPSPNTFQIREHLALSS